MSETKKVKILIKNGEININLTGFKGNQCDLLAQKLHPEDSFEVERLNKSEYYETTTQEELIHN